MSKDRFENTLIAYIREATLRCHDPNGEIYYVNFARDQISVTSYSDDAILAKVETWADGVAALA